MNIFISKEPVVRLIKAFEDPFINIVATAKTCYSSKGIVYDEQIDSSVEPVSRDMQLAKSIFEAGHHTTFQHSHFQFAIENVSRNFVWSFLHSHPYYNSEQVSQRYVEVKDGNFTIPSLQDEELTIYKKVLNQQIKVYHKLIDFLLPIVANEYSKIFPGRKLSNTKYQRDVKRKAQEIARYVLPIATHTYLYHTISGITLLRYYRISEQYDAPAEQKLVVQKMVDELLKFDPKYKIVLEKIIPFEKMPEYKIVEENLNINYQKKFIEEFDESLNGKISKLIDYKTNNEKVLAQAVREVFGKTKIELSDDEAIELVLNPAKNNLLAETMVLTTHSKLMRCLYHPNYTFRKKLSHTADSQNQRHRTTPASRPVLISHITEFPDYITPELIELVPEAKKEYDDVMQIVWDGINSLKKMNVKNEYLIYLLPNAFPIRFMESADLLNLHHKHVMRLCYNAQEEIWRASLEEVQQITEINPKIGQYLLPPCTLRSEADLKPICPEGERFCGVKVWKLDISEYSRII